MPSNFGPQDYLSMKPIMFEMKFLFEYSLFMCLMQFSKYVETSIKSVAANNFINNLRMK